MSFSVTVDAVAVSIQRGSLEISKVINRRDSLRAVVRSLDGSYRPATGKVIEVTHNSIVVFAGIIESVLERRVPGKLNAVDSEIVAASYKTLFDDYFVTETVADGTTLLAFLETLETNYFPDLGVTLAAGQATGPNLEAMDFREVSLATVFSELSRVTRYVWDANEDLEFEMFLPTATPAPYNISTADKLIDGDMTVERKRRTANRVVVIFGGEGLKPYTQSFVGDGSTDTFDLDFEIAGPIPYTVSDGAVGNAVVDYPTSTPGATESLAGVDAPAGFLWEYDPSGPTITRRSAAPPNLTTFAIRYLVAYPQTVEANDAAAQTADGRVRTKVFTATNVLSKSQAQALAVELLAIEVGEPIHVGFEVRAPGLRPGQVIDIDIDERDVDASFVIEGVTITNQRWLDDLEHFVSADSSTTSIGAPWSDLVRAWLGDTSSSAAPSEAVSGGGVAAPPEDGAQTNRAGQFYATENFKFNHDRQVLTAGDGCTIAATAEACQAFGDDCHIGGSW